MSEHQPATPPPQVKVAEFTRYVDAQEAVDRLSDKGFPVASVSIVWTGLRRVENVVGRRTVLTAALDGALSGAWFGTLIGLLFASLSDLPDGSNFAGVVFTYLVVGAVAGAVWLGVGHALRRGRRDFSSVPQLEAERYELWVDPVNADLATDLLDLRTHRPEDANVDLDGPAIGPSAIG